MEPTEPAPGDRRTELLERAYRRGYALRLRRRRRLVGAASLVAVLGLAAAAVGYANRGTSPSVSVAATTTTSTSATTSTTTTRPPVTVDPRVSVSLIVPAGGVPTGKQVHATLVIRNGTGAPIRSTACVPPGESVLGEMDLSKHPPLPPEPPTTPGTGKGITNGGLSSGCQGPAHDMVAVGTTQVPFLIEGSTTLCQFAPASQLGIDACLRGGEPLAPGTYYVDFIWYGDKLPTPTIPVQVVP